MIYESVYNVPVQDPKLQNERFVIDDFYGI